MASATSLGFDSISQQEFSKKLKSARWPYTHTRPHLLPPSDECEAAATAPCERCVVWVFFNQELDSALSGWVTALIPAGARLANHVRVKRRNQEPLIGHFPADLHKLPIRRVWVISAFWKISIKKRRDVCVTNVPALKTTRWSISPSKSSDFRKRTRRCGGFFWVFFLIQGFFKPLRNSRVPCNLMFTPESLLNSQIRNRIKKATNPNDWLERFLQVLWVYSVSHLSSYQELLFNPQKWRKDRKVLPGPKGFHQPWCFHGKCT